MLITLDLEEEELKALRHNYVTIGFLNMQGRNHNRGLRIRGRTLYQHGSSCVAATAPTVAGSLVIARPSSNKGLSSAEPGKVRQNPQPPRNKGDGGKALRREMLALSSRSHRRSLVTLHKMAGNASFSFLEAHVTHGKSTDIQVEVRGCNGCGSLFRPKRPWQKQCSARCRQRAYVRRQPMKTVSYYGA
jgi:hypothetical protein